MAGKLKTQTSVVVKVDIFIVDRHKHRALCQQKNELSFKVDLELVG